MIIDACCTIGSASDAEPKTDELIKLMDECKVDQAVLHAPDRCYAWDNEQGNEMLLRASEEYSGRLIATATANPWRSDAWAVLKKAIDAGAGMLSFSPSVQGFVLSEGKLDAILKDLSDQEAGLLQKQENENRIELSDYAKAKSYKAQIDSGLFTNEKELASYLDMSKQTLNDIMAYVRVPSILRESINNYSKLSKKTVTRLASLAKEQDILEVLIQLSDQISNGKITGANIDQYINKYRNLTPSIKNNVFYRRDTKGALIYEIKQKKTGQLSITISKNASLGVDCSLLNSELLMLLEKLRA